MIEKYYYMDCLGKWIRNNKGNFIDLQNKRYFILNDYENIIITEIYKDISKEDRAFNFYHILFNDKSELFIKVLFLDDTNKENEK